MTREELAFEERAIIAVQRGRDFLDSFEPNWRTLARGFFFESRTDCVLCRVAKVKNYTAALRKVRFSATTAVLHGFDTHVSDTNRVGRLFVYSTMERLWNAVIDQEAACH